MLIRGSAAPAQLFSVPKTGPFFVPFGADASALFTFSYSTPPRGRMTRINRLPEVVRDMAVPLKQDLIRDINLSLSGL